MVTHEAINIWPLCGQDINMETPQDRVRFTLVRFTQQVYICRHQLTLSPSRFGLRNYEATNQYHINRSCGSDFCDVSSVADATASRHAAGQHVSRKLAQQNGRKTDRDQRDADRTYAHAS